MNSLRKRCTKAVILFTPEACENIIIERLDRQKTIQGKTCVAFHYTMTSTSTFMDDDEHDVTVEGIAWIEETTGVPYEVENEITSLPIKSGKLTIKTLKHVERYNYVGGQWLANRIGVEHGLRI